MLSVWGKCVKKNSPLFHKVIHNDLVYCICDFFLNFSFDFVFPFWKINASNGPCLLSLNLVKHNWLACTFSKENYCKWRKCIYLLLNKIFNTSVVWVRLVFLQWRSITDVKRGIKNGYGDADKLVATKEPLCIKEVVFLKVVFKNEGCCSLLINLAQCCKIFNFFRELMILLSLNIKNHLKVLHLRVSLSPYYITVGSWSSTADDFNQRREEDFTNHKF